MTSRQAGECDFCSSVRIGGTELVSKRIKWDQSTQTKKLEFDTRMKGESVNQSAASIKLR